MSEVKNSEVQEEQKLQAVQDVESTEQPQQAPRTVENFGQALDVLMQAADLGRQKGIYDWNSLALISQSFAIINTVINNKQSENEQ